jgi:hypothetical protein
MGKRRRPNWQADTCLPQHTGTPHRRAAVAHAAQPKCGDWKAAGECTKNEAYMSDTCKKSCGKCSDQEKYFPETTTKVRCGPRLTRRQHTQQACLTACVAAVAPSRGARTAARGATGGRGRCAMAFCKAVWPQAAASQPQLGPGPSLAHAPELAGD